MCVHVCVCVQCVWVWVWVCLCVCENAVRSCMTLTQIETPSERERGQPHPAHGRCDSGSTGSRTNRAALSSEWPTSAQPGAGRRSSCSTGRESYGRCALGVSATKDVSGLLSLAFRRCPMDEVRPLCRAVENICCVHHCQLPLTDLDRSCPSSSLTHRAHRRPLVTAVEAFESASEAVLGACLTNRLGIDCAAD